MRQLILGLLLLNASPAMLAADTAPLEHFYGNTWQISRPEETIWIYVHPDGTWDGIFGGTFYAGKDWRVNGDIICFFNPPKEGKSDEDPTCFRGLAGHKVGETWKSVVEGKDKVWQSTLFKGRAVPPAGSAEKPSAGGTQG